MSNDAGLGFEHIGEVEVAGRLVAADLRYVPSAFAGLEPPGGAKVRIEVEARAGTWHALVAREEGGPVKVLMLCHGAELEAAGELEHAEPLGMLRVETGRVLLLVSEAQDDIRLPIELPLVPDSDLPGIVLDAGVAALAESPASYPVLSSPGQRKTFMFVVFDAD